MADVPTPSAQGSISSGPGDIRPIPDPTELTSKAVGEATAQIRRDMASLREIIEARIDAMDEATELRLRTTENTPSLIDEKIEHLRQLQDEKFKSIGLQFLERDIRTEQAAKSAGDALAAALQAAKELVGSQGEASAAAAVKSETSFTKQLDQVTTIISTLEKALDARITEMKERIDRGEGASAGQVDLRFQQRADVSEQRGGTSLAVAVGAMGITFLLLIVAAISLYAALKK